MSPGGFNVEFDKFLTRFLAEIDNECRELDARCQRRVFEWRSKVEERDHVSSTLAMLRNKPATHPTD